MGRTTAVSNLERHENILQYIGQHQRITIPEVCSRLGVSAATARRDLELLAEAGKLRRVHGGAIALYKAPPENPLLERSAELAVEKDLIGAAATGMVKDGETIFLGSGSTVLTMTTHLQLLRTLTVITNSLPVINALADKENITLIVLGGMFRASELSFIGHITELALAELRADRVFIGTRAIDVQAGLTNAYLPETMTDRAILHIGGQVVILADHTKCGRVSTALLATLESVHTLVTDRGTPGEFCNTLRQRGVEVILA
jgi:DeoR family transcriptional regulator, aga operon transcriptional repressor